MGSPTLGARKTCIRQRDGSARPHLVDTWQLDVVFQVPSLGVPKENYVTMIIEEEKKLDVVVPEKTNPLD